MKTDTTRRKWQKRVMAWRASGQTSVAFCSGKAFTAGGLRHWAYRLHRRGGRTDRLASSAVRVVRVKRVPAPTHEPPPPVSVAPSQSAITVEVGVARVSVGPEFDRATLSAVLEVLGLRDLGGAR